MRVRVSRWANGHTIVTVTITDGDHTSRYSQRAFSNTIPETIEQAKTGALKAMEHIRAA